MRDQAAIIAKYKLTDPVKTELVMKNQNLIRSVIRDKFHVYHEYYDDMMQEGMIGLIKAVASYDPDKGAQLSTFAYLCIKNEIQKFVSECTDPIRVPVSVGLAINGVRLVEENNGTDEDKKDVLQRLAISSAMLKAGQKALRYTSLDAETEDGIPLKCTVASEPYNYAEGAELEQRKMYNDFHCWLNYNYPEELLYNRIFIDYIYNREEELLGTTALYKLLKETYGANRSVVTNVINVYSDRFRQFLIKRSKATH